MKCKLVMDDWRRKDVCGSIYNTQLGLLLSTGDLHSGTTFEAEVILPKEVEEEIEEAMKDHGAYPVFRLIQGEKSESIQG